MAWSTNAEELSSNPDFDSFLSQLMDKDFNDILSDHQLSVSTLAVPNQSNETQLHPRFAKQVQSLKTQLGLPHGV